jgi:multiple sugar transport system permease protein
MTVSGQVEAVAAVAPAGGVRPARPHRSWLKQLWADAWWYVFIAPPVIGFFVFYAYPTVFALYSSFFKFNNFKFTPLENPLNNYERALNDPMLHRAFLNVLEMFVITFVGSQIISLFLAVLMGNVRYGVGFFRTIYYFPIVTSLVVIAAVFKWLLRGDPAGVLNVLVKAVTGGGPIRWLWEDLLIIPSISLVGIWASIGGSIIIWTAGLKGVPRELYEAAEIDGANAWRQFWGVTLPMLKPVMLYQLVLGFIGGMKAFGLNYVMLGAGYSSGMVPTPGLTPVLMVYGYGFKRMQMGYASAVAFILSVLILIVSIVQFTAFGNTELYD